MFYSIMLDFLNVGKSTLFNALTKSNIPAENLPFCTIDPHSSIVQLPDERLNELKNIYNPEKVTPATVEFIDIAVGKRKQ